MAGLNFPLSLFYREGGYSMGAISFDLISKENHSFENIVTSHPVENGSEISDHIENVLRTGSITGWVSNFSIAREDLSLLSRPINRAQEVYDAIKALWLSRELVTIVSVLEVYENVVFESVSCSRDGSTGEIQEFDIQFKEVRIVELVEKKVTAEVKGGKPTNAQARQASKKHNAGQGVTK